MLTKDYWSPRCALTWDWNRQHLNCPHYTAWITPQVVIHEPLSIPAASGNRNHWRAVPSLLDPTLPQGSGSCPPPPRARISSPPGITHLLFDHVPLDIFAACFATPACQILVPTRFPVSSSSNCITTLLWPLWGHYIINVLNWTALQNASASLLFVLLGKLNVKKCSCAVGTLCWLSRAPLAEGRQPAWGIQQPLLWLGCPRTKGKK